MKFKINTAAKILVWITIFLCVGYPIQTSIPTLLKIPTNQFNLIVRAILFLGTGYSFMIAVFAKNYRFSFGILFFTLFWLVYGTRLIYDTSFRGFLFEGYTDSFMVYSFAFGTSVFGTYAIFFMWKNVKIKDSLSALFIITLLSNIMLTYTAFELYNGDISSMLATRVNFSYEIDGKVVYPLNPILFSLYGEILMLISIYFLWFNPLKLKKSWKALFLFGVIFGFFNLVLGASRGPFLVSILMILVIFYLDIRRKREKLSFFIRRIAILSILITIGVYATSGRVKQEDLELFVRLGNFFSERQEGVKEARDINHEKAIEQFLSSPIIGDKYVIELPYGNDHPHNVFFETLMATGLVGFIFMLGFIISIFKRIYLFIKNIKLNPYLTPYVILYLTFFFASLTSGYLFANFNVWFTSAILLTSDIVDAKKLTPSVIKPKNVI